LWTIERLFVFLQLCIFFNLRNGYFSEGNACIEKTAVFYLNGPPMTLKHCTQSTTQARERLCIKKVIKPVSVKCVFLENKVFFSDCISIHCSLSIQQLMHVLNAIWAIAKNKAHYTSWLVKFTIITVLMC